MKVLLYTRDVAEHALVDDILAREDSIQVLHTSPLSAILGMACDQLDAVVYECDRVSQQNQQDLEIVERSGIPYCIVTYEVDDDMAIHGYWMNHLILKPHKVSAVFENLLLLTIRLMTRRVESDGEVEHAASTQVIGIAASTGGPDALRVVLKGLPKTLCGIVVVQHMIEKHVIRFAKYLNEQSLLHIKVADHGELIRNGIVYIAKQKAHLGIVKKSDGFHIHYQEGVKINCVCPSADILFESMADADAPSMTGIILTGMGTDGALGLKKLKERGGFTIIQNEATSTLYGMPKEAKRLKAYHVELALKDISAYLVQRYRNQQR